MEKKKIIQYYRKLVPKMDSDADGFIEEKELRDHINFMQVSPLYFNVSLSL
jgi:hypothetical protein